MCGIVGCAGDLYGGHEKVARTMLILDSIRGEDSTGVAVIGKFTGNTKVSKQVGDPFQLFEHKTFERAFEGMQRAIIGHNRYATVGNVTRTNAHPFNHESCVGVHNGTLKTKHLLADAKDFVVDSDNIYHHIDKHGLKDALKYMDGAWALVWWDKDNESINFLRNEERPLFIARSKDNKQIYWASEPWMIYASCHKHNLDIQEVDKFPANIHMSIHINNKGEMDKPKLVNAPSTYQRPAAVHYPMYQQPAQNVPVNAKVIPLTAKEVAAQAPAPVKKQGSTGLLVAPEPDKSYMNAKGVTLETMEPLTDQHGAKYVPCFDSRRMYEEIRLYAKPKDPIWDLIGQDIVANISGFNCAGKTPNKGYYKVSPHDFRILPPIEDDADTELVAGPTGKLMTKAVYKKHYPTCDYCSVDLVPGDANRFTTGGECMCPSCSKSDEVLQFVNFM